MITKRCKENLGFSILEVIIAIAIIMIGMTGVLSLVIQNGQVQTVNRDNLIASHLAQEGIELYRNLRDEEWLVPGTWDPSSDVKIRLYFDGSVINVVTGLTGIDDNNAKLMIDGQGFYSHAGTEYSGFRRIVDVDIISAEETKVTSIVAWEIRGKEYQYSIDTIFFNWN